MSFLENSNCYAAPGYGGHVPALKHEIAATYGNATRGLLKSDKSLLKAAHQPSTSSQQKTGDDAVSKLWGKEGDKGRVDDRFSFPPVAGITQKTPLLMVIV